MSFNTKANLMIIFIVSILIISSMIIENPKGFCNTKIENKKITHKIETISNYKSGIVIDKNIDSINLDYSVTIKRSVWRHNRGRSWEVDKIYVTEFEYNLVSLGDTIL